MLLLASPSLVLANTDARLLQVGSKGLYSYDVWTGESSLLIAGMHPGGTPEEHPYLSPHKKAVVTLGCDRSDRSYAGSIRISCYPKGTAFEIGGGSMCGLSGWTDPYHAVVWMNDDSFEVDARSGRMVGFIGKPKYAATVPKTAGDKLYKVNVAKDRATVRVRKSGKKVASFKVPGTGGTSKWWSAPGAHAVSPDGSHIVFEDMATPHHDSRVTWSLWVCTLRGKHATKLKFGSGGFLWR